MVVERDYLGRRMGSDADGVSDDVVGRHCSGRSVVPFILRALLSFARRGGMRYRCLIDGCGVSPPWTGESPLGSNAQRPRKRNAGEFWRTRDQSMMRPNTSLEPTAYAVPICMSRDSSITLGVSSPRLSRLWLSLIR